MALGLDLGPMTQSAASVAAACSEEMVYNRMEVDVRASTHARLSLGSFCPFGLYCSCNFHWRPYGGLRV